MENIDRVIGGVGAGLITSLITHSSLGTYNLPGPINLGASLAIGVGTALGTYLGFRKFSDWQHAKDESSEVKRVDENGVVYRFFPQNTHLDAFPGIEGHSIQTPTKGYLIERLMDLEGPRCVITDAYGDGEQYILSVKRYASGTEEDNFIEGYSIEPMSFYPAWNNKGLPGYNPITSLHAQKVDVLPNHMTPQSLYHDVTTLIEIVETSETRDTAINKLQALDPVRVELGLSQILPEIKYHVPRAEEQELQRIFKELRFDK